MKTIKDAVIRFNGVWQECFDIGFTPLGLTREQFEACAKRLGYISGYRWGVEYPTNGDKPNLASDVWLSVKEINATDFDHPRQVLFVKWHAVQSFMITDQRYKPADTGYLDEVSENPESNWQERGELPPVGIECETKFPKGEWVKCKIICHYNGAAVYVTHDRNVFMDEADYFRPIRTERERVIEAAEKAMLTSRVSNTQRKTIKRLYDSGMLVLPPKKSDTKD